MKKYLPIIILILFITVITGCKNKVIMPKTEFNLNEQAKLDDINIKLTKATHNNDILELVFEIENKKNNTYSIDPDKNFKFNDNQITLTNIYTNNKSIIKKDNKIVYTLQYKIDKREIYSIYFYSGIVDNNIKFTITSQDINK